MMDRTWRFILLLWIGLATESLGDYTSLEKNLQPNQSTEVKVALLVPLSGPKAALGQSLLDAASMALWETKSNHNLVLYPFDTNQIDTLLEDIQTLAPAVIVGPVFSQDTKMLYAKMPQSIPIFTLSNDPDLLEKGIFVMGISPFDEARFLLNFALKKGYKRVAALLPETPMGHSLEAIFKESLKDKSSHSLFYPATDDLCMEEAAKWAHQLNTFGPDAIFVPEGSPLTQKLIATLKFKNLHCKNLRFLGSAQWDKPSIFKDATLRGLWVPTNRSKTLQPFRKRLQKNFQSASGSLEAILYETILFIESSPTITKESLANHKAQGIYGWLTFRKNGSAVRPWHVLEHTGRGAKIAQ